MIQLSVNYSRGLAELLSSHMAPIQAIEFTPWLSPQQVSGIRQTFPHLLFHFHHGNLAARLKWDASTYQTLLNYLACTDCPWISAHISMLPPGHVFLARYLRIYLRGEPEEITTRWFFEQIAWLQERVSTPLILENMPSLSPHHYAYEVEPLHIRRVLDQTGTGFLLDLAHARVVASVFQRDVYEYLLQLPLDRTVQIHVSGPRLRKGMMYDAHDPMQEEDYRLLEWALERTQPQVVTLEYYKEKNYLAEQLSRLAALLS